MSRASQFRKPWNKPRGNLPKSAYRAKYRRRSERHPSPDVLTGNLMRRWCARPGRRRRMGHLAARDRVLTAAPPRQRAFSPSRKCRVLSHLTLALTRSFSRIADLVLDVGDPHMWPDHI
jgi:hypothetical protein